MYYATKGLFTQSKERGEEKKYNNNDDDEFVTTTSRW